MTSRPRPAGAYQVALRHGEQVFVAGMTPREGDTLLATGQVGTTVGLEEGARLAGVAARRALDAAATCLSGSERLVPLSMTVYVSTSRFDLPLSAVADGASDVVAAATGSLPVRAALGVSGLPGGSPVEVSLVLAAVGEGSGG
ncbi:RidA family protein [Auraticoccus monumenti]|uniref:Enamine deaminase RidA, house cleaning of reactive enamine intermediates, YjgF/YER057c/UK114 family n=1 Tax=Auraticoccus monumenti TaxID=675864 RepID=A0A1G7EZC7_9ACTN|nr:RidA family protein [Auraticoccus monumenti]SDE69009.1 Enamine deaminase RidA, house cleaning of reactive enamine intermediates, YjgF/YER057c/UK114 family [Auraticoccus monumenti]